MDSMTEYERSYPEPISGSQIRRIATGSGTSPRHVRDFVNVLIDIDRGVNVIRAVA